MEYTITAKHLRLPEPVKAYVEQKLSKLPRYYDGIGHVEVIFSGDTPGQVSVEIIAKAKRGVVFVATQDGHDLLGCLDAAIEKLARQLTKKKGIIRDHRQAKGKGIA
ncbi:MAG: ribosome-associated translation inhibitor RaiA [Sedimentisphaerales bacterium]|nr:ribosome-associated translation inhibitor RaiA [Sedimentisphaerales bacterium]